MNSTQSIAFYNQLYRHQQVTRFAIQKPFIMFKYALLAFAATVGFAEALGIDCRGSGL